MELKEGKIAKVINNMSGHSFDLGDIVTIISVDRNCTEGMPYRCSNGQYFQWIGKKDLQLLVIESTIVIKENTGIKDFAIQVIKYLEDHYGDHNYKAFLEVVNDKLK